MIGCIGEALTEAITVDEQELEDARWFHKDELRLMLDRTHPEGLTAATPMAIAHHLIRRWVGA
jgi:NAD+ diphosphatase